MASVEQSRDVLIIGGGPAGSTAASFLTMKGHSVTLFEKEKFPREHVGESLLPFCHDVFRDLGVLDRMKRRFVRKPGVRFISPDGSYRTTWCFDKVISDETYLSFQVTRSEFDQILLENARRLGADVHERTKVIDLHEDGDGAPVRLGVEGPDGDTRSYTAPFVIDASGRSTFIGSRNRWRRANEDLDRTALWSHYEGVELKGGLEEGLSIIVYLGGDKKGWSWVFPLGVDRVTVGFVTDNAYIREQSRRLQQEADDWQLALFEQEIRKSPFIRDLLSNARRSKDLFVNGDYSYFVDTKYGKNFALIGDAGRFIDPIFSSGVYLSMKSARLVAEALDTMFRGDPKDLSPLDAAYGLIDGAYNFVHRMIRLFYNPHALSWAQAPMDMDTADAGLAHRHGDAMAAGHYMLAGDFFEKHEEYDALFQLLEKPRTFGQYKHLVIDTPRLQDATCRRDPPTDNFPVK